LFIITISIITIIIIITIYIYCGFLVRFDASLALDHPLCGCAMRRWAVEVEPDHGMCRRTRDGHHAGEMSWGFVWTWWEKDKDPKFHDWYGLSFSFHHFPTWKLGMLHFMGVDPPFSDKAVWPIGGLQGRTLLHHHDQARSYRAEKSVLQIGGG
jgi:hypothetical protein